VKRGESGQARRVLVVGGQGRGVGKTALIEDLLRAFPAAGWVAAKITPHEHRPGSIGPEGFALEEERDGNGRSDSSRFLAAGARRSFWVQARPERLAEALATLGAALGEAENLILESNAVLDVLEPATYLAVIDPCRAEVKPSLAVVLARADAVVLRRPLEEGASWARQPELLAGKARFLQPLGAALPAAVVDFLRERLFH
jgi:hypothetical protein